MTSPLPPPTAYFAGGQIRGSPHALPRAAATQLASTPPSSPTAARLGRHPVQVRRMQAEHATSKIAQAAHACRYASDGPGEQMQRLVRKLLTRECWQVGNGQHNVATAGGMGVPRRSASLSPPGVSVAYGSPGTLARTRDAGRGAGGSSDNEDRSNVVACVRRDSHLNAVRSDYPRSPVCTASTSKTILCAVTTQLWLLLPHFQSMLLPFQGPQSVGMKHCSQNQSGRRLTSLHPLDSRCQKCFCNAAKGKGERQKVR